MTADHAGRVIVAAAVGNVIEWYDFYIFGSLAAILSVQFFEKTHPVAALLSTSALFTAGFLIRPLGAFLFGWLGDRVGRKYTFLSTLTGMGLGTGALANDVRQILLAMNPPKTAPDATVAKHDDNVLYIMDDSQTHPRVATRGFNLQTR